MKGLKSEQDKQKNAKKKDKNKGDGEEKGPEVGDVEGDGEEGKGGDVLYRVLEARQLAIKLLANVTCKYCITSFSFSCSKVV